MSRTSSQTSTDSGPTDRPAGRTPTATPEHQARGGTKQVGKSSFFAGLEWQEEEGENADQRQSNGQSDLFSSPSKARRSRDTSPAMQGKNDSFGDEFDALRSEPDGTSDNNHSGFSDPFQSSDNPASKDAFEANFGSGNKSKGGGLGNLLDMPSNVDEGMSLLDIDDQTPTTNFDLLSQADGEATLIRDTGSSNNLFGGGDDDFDPFHSGRSTPQPTIHTPSHQPAPMQNQPTNTFDPFGSGGTQADNSSMGGFDSFMNAPGQTTAKSPAGMDDFLGFQSAGSGSMPKPNSAPDLMKGWGMPDPTPSMSMGGIASGQAAAAPPQKMDPFADLGNHTLIVSY